MISGRDMSVVVLCSLQSFHVILLILFLVVRWRRRRQRILDRILVSLILLFKSDSLRLSMWVFCSECKDGLLFFVLDITASAYCA